ncbi:uncharacterized protein BDZ83DRAFT_45628 [Colletotrichum acutatum]|uniref:Uncharacterized protein n=1 Tax=Glomerella acutata TaxID=27357 RepID=A0AAD8XE86_GLOAC|nr:uncharacterized protein BDZ83DRAFT_45628 [Colletotrichum acutatum]KAK1716036.1 hypothetical protein BDZ83DRAFT_45628 [Colletotrichum acutatum]
MARPSLPKYCVNSHHRAGFRRDGNGSTSNSVPGTLPASHSFAAAPPTTWTKAGLRSGTLWEPGRRESEGVTAGRVCRAYCFGLPVRSHAACRLLVVVFLAAGLHFETKRMAGGLS